MRGRAVQIIRLGPEHARRDPRANDGVLRHHVNGTAAAVFRVGAERILYILPDGELRKPRRRADVNKQIVAVGILNEPVTTRGVKPTNNSNHFDFSCLNLPRNRARRPSSNSIVGI